MKGDHEAQECASQAADFRTFEQNFSGICGAVENPKPEARNPKQYPRPKIRMTKTVEGPLSCFEHSSFLVSSLFRISDFHIRI
jgi:hypothetical protein